MATITFFCLTPRPQRTSSPIERGYSWRVLGSKAVGSVLLEAAGSGLGAEEGAGSTAASLEEEVVALIH